MSPVGPDGACARAGQARPRRRRRSRRRARTPVPARASAMAARISAASGGSGRSCRGRDAVVASPRRRRSVSVTTRPSSISIWRGRRVRCGALVRDHDDRRPERGSLRCARRGRGSLNSVALSRLPVGSSARGSPGPDDRAGDRHALTLATREPRRARRRAVREADRSRAGVACARRSRAATPAERRPSATLSRTLWCSAKKKFWKTKPIEVARSAGESPVRRSRRRRAR